MPSEALLELWARSPAAYGVVFVLGALFGSFANVCILRLPPTEEHPGGRSIVRPGSRCESCGTPIRLYDNVPILSYLLLRGRCRRCRSSFSPRYLLVEAATGALFVALYHLSLELLHQADPFPMRLARFAILAAFAVVLVVIAFIDLDHKLILDRITYPAIPAFYLFGLVPPERAAWHGLVGAAVGYGVVRLISDGYYYLTRREGLGYGDGKLLAIVGALLGWQAVAFTLFMGSLLGAAVAIPLLVVQRRRAAPDPDQPSLRHVEVPFGPFLVAGALTYPFIEPWLKAAFSPVV